MSIKIVVWGENVHEQSNEIVASLYPNGMHNQIADVLETENDFAVTTVTLQQKEHGLTKEVLEQGDVLLWCGHAAHGEVKDEVVERVVTRVWQGMGLIVLHSGYFFKVFKRLMGALQALDQPQPAKGFIVQSE